MPQTPRPDNKDIIESSADFEFEPLPAKPDDESIDFGRRIKWLMAGICVAIIVYSTAWFWFGQKLVELTQTAINHAASGGKTMICKEPASMGYPFRMGLSCATSGYFDPAKNLKIEAGAFRSAAQVYKPDHMIAELDGPFTVSAAGLNPLTLNWALAHASINGFSGLPKRVSIEIEKPAMAVSGAAAATSGAAKLAAFHMRKGDNNQIELASTIEGISIHTAPVFNFSIDAFVSGTTRFMAALESGRPLIEVLRENDGQLRALNVTFANGGSIAISGPFSISATGLLSAKLNVKAEKATQVIDNISAIFAFFGVATGNLNALKALAISDQIDLTISITNGNASIGFIPIGAIPAL